MANVLMSGFDKRLCDEYVGLQSSMSQWGGVGNVSMCQNKASTSHETLGIGHKSTVNLT